MRSPRIVGVGVRRATSLEWATSTLVMLQGEVGRDITTGMVKFGDGVRTWVDLPAAAAAPAITTAPAPVAESDDWPDLVVMAEAAMA